MRSTLHAPLTSATPLDPLVAHLWTLGWALLAPMAAANEPEDDLDDDREPEADAAPLEWVDCYTCGGSGGGDGYWRCQSCGGRGRTRNAAWVEDRELARADEAYDRWKDERADRERGGR
jgi:hypothetical protein